MSQQIGFRTGILHVITLICSKHFWWSGDHLNGTLFVHIVCNGPIYALMFGKKQAKYSIRPRKQRTCVWSLGVCQSLSLANLLELAWTLWASTLQPSMSKTGANGSNFFLLMYNFSSLRQVYTQSRYLL